MSAYFLIELDVEHGDKLTEYERQATEYVLAAGGRFIIRGNDYRPIEGDWHPKRIILVEFDSIEAIERFYWSEPNQRLKKTRLQGTAGKPARAIAIQGLASAADPTADGKPAPKEAGVDETGTVVWS